MPNCSCARQMYRDNEDGTRDHKIAGKSSCQKCQGYGRILTCGGCTGCGLLNGQRCPTCFGQGVIPDRSRQKTLGEQLADLLTAE